MPLSEYEQRVLEQMERELLSEDPRLATVMQSPARSGANKWLVAGLALAAGLLALVGGAVMSNVWLGVGGFVVMFVGVAYAFAPPRATSSGPVGVVNQDGSTRPVGKRRGAPHGRGNPRGKGRQRGKGGFMASIEERWDRRRDEGR